MRRFIWTLVFACVLVVGVAYALGWFTITTEREEGKFTTSVEIYTGRIKNATHTVEEKAKNLGESVKEHAGNPSGTETAKGSVTAVQENAREFTLGTSDGRDLIIDLDGSSSITAPHLNGLQVGDRVTVVYKSENGKNTARSVTVEPGT